MSVAEPVNQAMDARRPDKQVIRHLWRDLVTEAEKKADGDDTPLYLTLPGALGLDIELLVEAGVIKLTENGSIAASDQWKIVAVERNGSSVLALKKRYTGLRVLNEDIANVLRSTGPFSWPDRKDFPICRARVVNLDLNAALRVELDTAVGHFIFPTLLLIKKFAQLHCTPPMQDWVMCVTVAAQIDWPVEASRQVQLFLAENFRAELGFAEASRGLLGDALYERILDAALLDFAALSVEQQQAVLMVFVPKKVVADTHAMGWKITTTANLRYGGQPGVASMATWVMRFERDTRAGSLPLTLYREGLTEALKRAGSVSAEGEVRQAPGI